MSHIIPVMLEKEIYMTQKSRATKSLPTEVADAVNRLGEHIRTARKRRRLILEELASRMFVPERRFHDSKTETRMFPWRSGHRPCGYWGLKKTFWRSLIRERTRRGCSGYSGAYLKNVRRACRLVMGCGGHPGIYRSTGKSLSSPSVISGLPRNGPPDRAQLPTAMTTRGSGVAS